MKTPLVFVSSFEAGSPASIEVKRQASDLGRSVFFDVRESDAQFSFLFDKLNTPPIRIPDEFLGFATLLGRPVLVLKILALESGPAWLMLDWDIEEEYAKAVIMAHSTSPGTGRVAAALKRAAEQAIRIHHVFS